MKKASFKKTLLLSSILLGATTVPQTAQASWCGYPVCPGDIVSDALAQKFRAHLQTIRDSFVNGEILSAIYKDMENQFNLFKQDMMGSFERSKMVIGIQTDVETDLYNQAILKDLQPLPDEACSVLSWQDYVKTDTSNVTEQSAMSSASRSASKSLDGTGATAREKNISFFYRMLSVDNTAASPFSPSQWHEKDLIDSDTAKAGLLAVDMLTHVEGRDDTEVAPSPTLEGKDVTNSYKERYVIAARKALILNIMKNYLSDPIYRRLGVANGSEVPDISLEDFENEKAPTTSNENNEEFQSVVNSSEDVQKSIEDGQAVESINNGEEPAMGDFVGVNGTRAEILKNFLATPMQYTKITSEPGPRIAPTTGASTSHAGVDLAAPVGTPIYAPADADVVVAGPGTGFGYYVTLSHGADIYSRYGHITPNIPVEVGDFVKKGDLIAYSGNTGTSTGPHLHYEIRLGGTLGFGGDVVHPFARQGMSEMKATQDIIDEVLGVGPVQNTGGTSIGKQLADGETFPPELQRKLLIVKAMQLERAVREYKEIEKQKLTKAIDVIINNDNIFD